MELNTKKIAVMAMFIALSVALSLFAPIPTATGNVGFDALPAYVASGILGPVYGGIVGMFGHLSIATTSGFPFGLDVHIIISLFMFVALYSYGYIYKKINNKYGIILATVVGISINLIGVIPVGFIIGFELILMLLPMLTLAAIVNAIFGSILVLALKNKINNNF